MALTLKLSDSAYKLWKEFWRETEKKLGPDCEFELMSDWGSKLPGATARIAALFHIAKNHQRLLIETEVQDESMCQAILFTQALQTHARKAFHLMSADPNFDNAKYILRWIKKTKQTRFTQRECHKALQSRFPKVDTLKAALKILEDRNYIKYLGKEAVPYRPSDPFAVHPQLNRSDAP